MTGRSASMLREKMYTIPAFDDKNIWCCRNYADDTPSDKAVILAHGLTGNPNEYIHMAARDYFLSQGYDVYRFAFYFWTENCRNLLDCTLDIHAQDMNSMIAHVRPQYKKLYVCGHSYGGLTMVFANPHADAIAFWDPAYHAADEIWNDWPSYIPELDCYSFGWGMTNLIGKAMVEEGRTITPDVADSFAQKLTAPSIVIEAEKGGLGNAPSLFNALQTDKSFETIKWADHCFYKGDIVRPLLETTHNWFKKF